MIACKQQKVGSRFPEWLLAAPTGGYLDVWRPPGMWEITYVYLIKQTEFYLAGSEERSEYLKTIVLSREEGGGKE